MPSRFWQHPIYLMMINDALTDAQKSRDATRRHVSTATATAPPTMPQGNTACEHLSGAEMQNSFGVKNSVPNVQMQAMSLSGLYVYIRTSSISTNPGFCYHILADPSYPPRPTMKYGWH